MTLTEIKALIRGVPDFPKPGIVFKDITPLLSRPEALGASSAARSSNAGEPPGPLPAEHGPGGLAEPAQCREHLPGPGRRAHFFVAAVVVFLAIVRRPLASSPRWVSIAPAYAIGGVAMFWTLQRVASLG